MVKIEHRRGDRLIDTYLQHDMDRAIKLSKSLLKDYKDSYCYIIIQSKMNRMTEDEIANVYAELYEE